MKQFFYDYGTRCLRVMVILPLLAGLLGPGHARGEDLSGLGLSLHTDDDHTDDDHTDFQYQLGKPIKLIMVIKNVSGQPINTERGFSQVELQKTLLVTDPTGTKHSLSQETIATTPEPPLFLNNQLPTSPAETLAPGWVRSATIDDLRVLFPVMNKDGSITSLLTKAVN